VVEMKTTPEERLRELELPELKRRLWEDLEAFQ